MTSDFMRETINEAFAKAAAEQGEGGGGGGSASGSSSGVASTGGSANVGGGPTLHDVATNNLFGFGVDLVSTGSGVLGKGANLLGDVLAPISMVTDAVGLATELSHLRDPDAGESVQTFDPNNLMTSLYGFGGGLASTLGMIGVGGGTTLGGAATAGAGGALGAAGSVVGAGAAGLLGGHYLARAADSEIAEYDDGETTYDRNTRGAIAIRETVNETLGLDSDSAVGDVAAIPAAAVGGIGAGIMGGARAAAGLWDGLF